ncbi:hypothetical protein GCM10020001_000960 [Nonomuraea salmonea]
MIFVMQLGLARLWNAYGVEPVAVIGHSVGEIAAAVTAGAMSVADGARLICRRSRLLRQAAGKGAMAMVGLSFEEASERLAGRTDLVAAIASAPGSTVLSGDPAAVEAVLDEWPAEGIIVRRVASDVAFHSPQMEPLAVELAAATAGLAFGAPRIPMYTTTLPDPRSTPVLDSAYWAANLRDPVRLAAATAAAAEDGHRVFLEISPHPVVAHSVTETLSEHGYEDVFVGTTLRRNQPELPTFEIAVGTAHCHGVEVDWRRLQPSGGLTTLPPVRLAAPPPLARLLGLERPPGPRRGLPHPAGRRDQRRRQRRPRVAHQPPGRRPPLPGQPRAERRRDRAGRRPGQHLPASGRPGAGRGRHADRRRDAAPPDDRGTPGDPGRPRTPGRPPRRPHPGGPRRA